MKRKEAGTSSIATPSPFLVPHNTAQAHKRGRMTDDVLTTTLDIPSDIASGVADCYADFNTGENPGARSFGLLPSLGLTATRSFAGIDWSAVDLKSMPVSCVVMTNYLHDVVDFILHNFLPEVRKDPLATGCVVIVFRRVSWSCVTQYTGDSTCLR
jgi:hypothetical protein